MSGYTLTGVETTLIIERSETNLNPVISSVICAGDPGLEAGEECASPFCSRFDILK